MLKIQRVSSVRNTKKGVFVDLEDQRTVRASPDSYADGDSVFVLEKGYLVPIRISNIWVLHREFAEKFDDNYFVLNKNVAVKVNKAYPTAPYKKGSRDRMSLIPGEDDFMEILGILENKPDIQEEPESVDQ